MDKHEFCAGVLFMCCIGMVLVGGIMALVENWLLTVCTLAAIAAVIIAFLASAEWIANRAINRKMDNIGKDRAERELRGASPYCKGTTSYSAGASRDMCPYRRPSNKRAWRAGWLAARRDDLAKRKGA